MDLCYTPMIMADSFTQSSIARSHELTLDAAGEDGPLVVQFAARNARELGDAAALAAPHVDAIDLNCGCPQRWALAEGVGAALLDDDEDWRGDISDSPPKMGWDHLTDMIGQARERSGGKPISIKIRILPDLVRTVSLARQLEHAGVSWITVHGRTRDQRPGDPVNLEAIRLIRESVGIPVIGNGGIFSMADAEAMVAATGVRGVMAARGILENPMLFVADSPTWSCVDEYVRLAVAYGTPTAIFHHHLSQMTGKLLTPSQHHLFSGLATTSVPCLVDYLNDCRP